MTTKIILSLVLLVGVLVLSRIILSSAFSVDGIALAHMQTEIASLNRDNMVMRERLYAAASYTMISSEAASLGFVEAKSHIALQGSSSLAIRQ